MQAVTATQQISIVKLCRSPNSAWLEYLLRSLILLSKQAIFISKERSSPFKGQCVQRVFIIMVRELAVLVEII